MIKKGEQLVVNNSYGFIYTLVMKESEYDAPRWFADIVGYPGLQSIA